MIPAMFVVAKSDVFVRPHHGKNIYEKYGGKIKIFREVEGAHNDSRPAELLKEISEFIYQNLYETNANNSPFSPKNN